MNKKISKKEAGGPFYRDLYIMIKNQVMWIRKRYGADPEPGFAATLNADPDFLYQYFFKS